MASTDLDGSPIVILTRGEADHAFDVLSQHGGEEKLLRKLKRFLDETTDYVATRRVHRFGQPVEDTCSDDTNCDSSPAKAES